MIEVHGMQVIEDEKEREAARAVIDERLPYYEKLFSREPRPHMTLRYESQRPLVIRMKFTPPGKSPKVIVVESYSSADAATKYALKKMRRVAKNYFLKTKPRHH